MDLIRGKMTFRELARIGVEQLAKQKPISLEKAREQVKMIMERIEGKTKKQAPQKK